MKTTFLTAVIFFFTCSIYSQSVFIYGESGEKIYFKEVDSIIQIKFKENTESVKALSVAKKVNPDINSISVSKSNRINVTLSEKKQVDYNNLKSSDLVVYANSSLLNNEGEIQIPTDKILVKIKNEYTLGEVLGRLSVPYTGYEQLGYNKNSYMITLKNGESLNIANSLDESGYSTRQFLPLVT